MGPSGHGIDRGLSIMKLTLLLHPLLQTLSLVRFQVLGNLLVETLNLLWFHLRRVTR